MVRVMSSLCRNAEWMKIGIFTTSYSKLSEMSLGSQMAGVLDTAVELRDEHGVPLADGLYYLIVETPFELTVGKLLVER